MSISIVNSDLKKIMSFAHSERVDGLYDVVNYNNIKVVLKKKQRRNRGKRR